MKILITGATGFLGQTILSYIYNDNELKNADVSAFVLPNDKHEKDINKYLNNYDLKIIHGDICIFEEIDNAIKGIDIVIHTAGLISYWRKDLKKLINVNVNGTENIVNSCINNKVKKLIHISSVGAIGFNKNGDISNENTKFNYSKNLYYMQTKFKGQSIVENAILEKKLNAIILCPASIMGPGDPDINTPHNQIYKKIYENKMYGCFAGGLAVVDVRDIAKIIVKNIKFDYKPDKYLVVGKNLTYKNVIKTIEKYSNKKTYPFIVSPFFLSIAGLILEFISYITGKKPLLTYGYGRLSGYKAYYSNEKSIVEFEHNYYNFDDTITDSCKYFEKKFINKL